MFQTYSLEFLDKLLPTFGIYITDNDYTDPEKMKLMFSELDIDIEQLSLGDSSGILKRLIYEKIPLSPFKDRILMGLSQNPPLAQSMVEIANAIKSQKINLQMISPIRQSQIQYFIYYLVILEVFVHLILNDNRIERHIAFALFNKRASRNPGSSFWNFISSFIKTKGDLFFSLKLISIDPAIYIHMCWRQYFPNLHQEELEKFIRENRLTGLNASTLREHLKKQIRNDKHNGNLCANILEAVITENNLIYNRSFIKKIFPSHVSKYIKNLPNQSSLNDNAKAGLALILYQEKYENTYSIQGFDEMKAEPEIKIMNETPNFWSDLYNYSTKNNVIGRIQSMPKEWNNLYISWNIAFVLRQYPNLFHIVLPKLLLPETLAINSELFIASRVTSLWLTVNFFRIIKSKYADQYPFLDLEKYLNIIGINNLRYAQSTLFKNNVNLDKTYDDYIKKPFSVSLYRKIITALKGGFIFKEEDRLT